MRRAFVLALVACSSPQPTPVPPPRPLAPDAPVAVVEPAFTPPARDQACEPATETPDSDYYYDVGRRASSTNACAVADNNIAREEAALAKPKDRKAAGSKPWNHTSPPARLDPIAQRFALDKTERAKLMQTGAIALARAEQPSYAYAYHEIFQSQLPVYITADSIFHAIFSSHDSIVETLEKQRLAGALSDGLDQLHCALFDAAKDYPRDTARDLDLYLIVARTLAGGKAVASKLGDADNEREAAALVKKIQEAAPLETITLFGRPHAIDFTQFRPRGHYAGDQELEQYFRAAMWASRLDLNLVSRSSRSSLTTEPDPRETPREAIDAFALADLAHKSGADKRLAVVERAWDLLAGKREDVTLAQLEELRTKAHVTSLRDPGAFAALKAAIGDGYKRTTRVHPMPEGSKDLPVIATLIGPRIVTDAHAIMPLVSGAVPKRTSVAVADIAYTLGFDHAKTFLATELSTFPNLDKQLEVGRTIVNQLGAPIGDDLYGAWFAAIRALATPPTGIQPSFLTSQVGKDLRMSSIAAAYGQLKHNYVLMAGQAYSEFGCEIPDGFVEPVPAAYRALAAYAKKGEAMAAAIDPKDGMHIKQHFQRVGAVLSILASIADDELADRPLTTDQKQWIGLVAELSLSSEDVTGHPPYYTGWYFDLFYRRQDDGMRGAELIADYFTGDDRIAYAGATAPRMGVFVIDTSGAPRAFAGPIARGFELHGPPTKRFTDKDIPPTVEEPWAASYTVPAPPEPTSLHIKYDPEKGVVVHSDLALGSAKLTLLDHHRTPIKSKQVKLTSGEQTIPLRAPKTDAILVEIGAFRGWALAGAYGDIDQRWGAVKADDQE